jgi:hypothetical protein
MPYRDLAVKAEKAREYYLENLEKGKKYRKQ